MSYCYQNWLDESLMQVKDDNDLCKGQSHSRSNVVKNVLLLPTLARKSLNKLKMMMMTFIKVKGQQSI